MAEISEVTHVINQENLDLSKLDDQTFEYRYQRFKISPRLRRMNFDEITVVTAENTQGKGRPVMLIRTV